MSADQVSDAVLKSLFAQRAALNRRRSPPGLSDDQVDAWCALLGEEVSELEELIADRPARTLEGLLIKLHLAEEQVRAFGGQALARFVSAAVRDAERLAARSS